MEVELVELLKELHQNKKQFALSNVLEKFSPYAKNEVLDKWIFQRNDIQTIDIDYHYRGSSYNKKNRTCKRKRSFNRLFQFLIC